MRSQLPPQWAMSQSDLGDALQEQGARSNGAMRIELLNQAVAAYQGALEVYTIEAFPFYHKKAAQSLNQAEALLREANSELSHGVK